MKDFLQNIPRSFISMVSVMLLGALLALNSTPVFAQAATISNLSIDSVDDGEALIFSLDGYTRPNVEVIPEAGAVAVSFTGAAVADGFLIPNLDTTNVVDKITYKLGFQKNVREVTFTFYLDTSLELNESICRLEEKDGLATLIILNSPALNLPTDLLSTPAEPIAPEKPDFLTEIVSIDIGSHAGGEKVSMKTSNPAIPLIREFSFPNRVAIEIEGGYLTDELVDKFLYENPIGLISKVDLFVSPAEERGIFQMIITAEKMSYYDVKYIDDATIEFLIFKMPESSAPALLETTVSQPEPVQPDATPVVTTPVVTTPEQSPTPVVISEVVAEPEPIAVATTVETDVPDEVVEPTADDEMEYEDIPVVKPETKKTDLPPAPLSQDSVGYSLGYGDTNLIDMDSSSTEVGGIDDELEYPDLPVDEEGTDWDFPEMEPSTDPNHISDAIVSLNFVNAQFIDVMMILAQQAGVNFVLDAYWNQSPTGHSRERPVGGPGGSGFSGGGFQPGGGWNPPLSGGGSVTLFMQEVPFDSAFDLLMKANNLDYKVFRETEDAEPLLFLSTRERLEGELGLGVIKSYQLHYIPPDSALDFLYRMDMLPSSSGFGFWFYGGGGGGTGGSGGQGGGGSPGGGGFGGGGGGGGGGYGNMPMPGGGTPDYTQPINMTASSQYQAWGQTLGVPQPQPMQFGGGGSPGGGGFGGGGTGGGGTGGGGAGGGGQGGQPYTAKGGVIAIMATQEMHDTIDQALNQVDKPPKQVYVEAIFISSDENPLLTPKIFGVENFGQWAFEGGGDRFFGQFDVTGTEGLVFSILPKNQSVPYEDFRTRFQYLFDDRYARIVTAPRVAVIDGYTATISVNEQRPFIVDGGIIIDQFGNAVPAPDQVTMVPTGTTLTITPFIDDYGNITMNLTPNQTQMLGEPTLINGNLIFGTQTSSVTTTLRMRDGETIVLGGMTTRNRDVNKKYLPLLGDIPLIGQFFGRKTVVENESQLVVLMTVHLVGD